MVHKTVRLAGACVGLLVLTLALVAAQNDLQLVDAVKHGRVDTVAALLKQGVDVNAAEGDGATALHWAAHRDDLKTAALLIRAGARVNAVNEYGVSPMSLACANGSSRMVAMLLKAGADPDAAQASGETPLMSAARSGNVELVRMLLAAGADLGAQEERKGQTALMWAVAEQHVDVARALIDEGADVDARSKSGFMPLLFAARDGNVELARMLLEAGASVNGAAGDGTTALLVATVRGHAPLVRYLLDHGADPNADGAGYTALHWAAGSWETTLNGPFGVEGDEEWNRLRGLDREEKLALVQALVGRGANPNARIAKQPARFGFTLFQLRLVGATPFLLAAMAGDAPVMRALAAAGADPLASTADQATPLMVAAGIGRVVGESRVTEAQALEAVTLALDLGGDINAAKGDGETALHGAAYVGADSIVRLLVDKGARLNPKNRCGWTPLTIAQGVYHLGVVITHDSTAALLRTLGGESDPAVQRGSTGGSYC